MLTDIELARMLDLETIARKKYCEQISWDFIIDMLSEDDQKEYYELVKKNDGY